MLTLTTNGGKSWERTSLPVGHAVSNGIACPSSTHCYVVGSDTPADGAPSGLLFATTNAGRSWTSQSLPSGTTDLLSIACRATATCVVVGGGIGPRGGPGVGMILTT